MNLLFVPESKQPNMTGFPIYSSGKGLLFVVRCSNGLQIHNLVSLAVRAKSDPKQWSCTEMSYIKVDDHVVVSDSRFLIIRCKICIILGHRLNYGQKIGHDANHKCDGSYMLCRQRVRLLLLARLESAYSLICAAH